MKDSSSPSSRALNSRSLSEKRRISIIERVRSRVSSRIHSLSLTSRLWLLFLMLVLPAAGIGFWFIYEHNHISARSSALVTAEHGVLRQARQLEELLEQVSSDAARGIIPLEKIQRMRVILDNSGMNAALPGGMDGFLRLREKFDAYVLSLEELKESSLKMATPFSEAQIQATQNLYRETRWVLGDFVNMSQVLVSQMLREVNEAQIKTTRIAILGFLGILILLVIAAFKSIAVMAKPLQEISRIVDDTNVEDDSFATFPKFRFVTPEVTRLVRSFERLLQRLYSYRALNLRRLLMEKRRAEVIAASISDGIFLLRGDEILFVNPIGLRILGQEGNTWRKGVSLKSLPESRGAQAILRSLDLSLPFEFTSEQGGEKFQYLLHAQPISSELIQQLDDSIGAHMEALLGRWEADTLVIARDVTLVHETQEAKSHFLATLSHEVKTPVTSLTMATRLLKKAIRKIEDPMHRKLIETCAEDVDRLRVLLNDLLSASGFNTLTQRLEVQNVDLGKLIKQSVQFFQGQAQERGIELKAQVQSQSGPIVVQVDAAKISWAISNLLTNALRHTPRNGQVDATLNLTENDEARVVIQDSGPGIDQRRQKRIFDKFSPYYDLRVARSGSAGMGLAIAREIIVAHGGRIWVSSELGKGAEFTFIVPKEPRRVSEAVVQSDAKGSDLNEKRNDDHATPVAERAQQSSKFIGGGSQSRAWTSW